MKKLRRNVDKFLPSHITENQTSINPRPVIVVLGSEDNIYCALVSVYLCFI